MTAQLTPPPTPVSRMYTVQAPPVHANSGASLQSKTHNARMSRGLPIDALLSSRPEPAQDRNIIEKSERYGRIYYEYRKSWKYMFPADDTEHERLDILHDLIYGTALGGQLHQTVFRNPPRRILDVGFGSGFWMIEAGKRYPDCQIIGFDLDNALGTEQDRNCWFRSPVDFTAPRWDELEDGSVDLVHLSQLCGCVPSWEDLYAKAFRSLRPDSGHIEHIEFDWTPRSNEPQIPQAQDLRNWWNWLVLASEGAGKSLRHREDTEDLLENAGFVDVSHKRVRVPLFNAGTKDKRERKLAHAYQTAMGHQDSQSFTGFSMLLFEQHYGWPDWQSAEICAKALAVVQGQPLPLYITLYVGGYASQCE